MGRNFSNPQPHQQPRQPLRRQEGPRQGFILSIEMEAQKKRIVLFDVDGTLVKPMGVRQYDNNRNKGEIEGLITFVVCSEHAVQRVTPEMSVFLEDLRKILPTAIVGGSNFDKQRYQIGEDGTTRHPTTSPTTTSPLVPYAVRARSCVCGGGAAQFCPGSTTCSPRTAWWPSRTDSPSALRCTAPPPSSSSGTHSPGSFSHPSRGVCVCVCCAASRASRPSSVMKRSRSSPSTCSPSSRRSTSPSCGTVSLFTRPAHAYVHIPPIPYLLTTPLLAQGHLYRVPLGHVEHLSHRPQLLAGGARGLRRL